MKIKEFNYLINLIFPSITNKIDNTGLILGNYNTFIKGIMLCNDISKNIINEAKYRNFNLILTYHPILFNKFNKITSNNRNWDIINMLIKNNIYVYSLHSSLDIYFKYSPNKILLNIITNKISKYYIKPLVLFDKYKTFKIISYIDVKYIKLVIKEIYNISTIFINYSNYLFNYYISNSLIKFNYNKNLYYKLYIILSNNIKNTIINILDRYNFIYYIYNISNKNNNLGYGATIKLKKNIKEIKILNNLKNIYKDTLFKTSEISNKNIKKISIMVGSGRKFIKYAIKNNSDIFITSDLKYHDFINVKNKMLIVDIGHFESEIINIYIINYILKKYIKNIPILISNNIFNPVFYF